MKKNLTPKPFALPTPVFIVTTYDENLNANAMNVAWGGVCNSSPPCLAISVREDRKTYENILLNKCFTVNLPSENLVEEADYFGLVSGNKENKFSKSGLTPVKSNYVNAPYIKEFPLSIECKVLEIMELGSHYQIIGEIVNIIADQSCLDDNDNLLIEKAKPILFNPLSYEYYGTGEKVGKAFSIGKKILDK